MNDEATNREMNDALLEEASEDAESAPAAISISVDNLRVTIDPAQLASEFVEMGEADRAAKRIWLSSLFARAKAEAIRGDAVYRSFRSEATAAMVKKDSKLAEWKCRVQIEASPQFKEMKSDIAECEMNAVLLRGVLDALALVPPAGEPAY